MSKQKHPLLVTGGIIGLGTCLAVYPFVSNYLYEKSQEDMILEMNDVEIDDSVVEMEKEAADAYNRYLLEENIILTDPFDPEAFAKDLQVGYADIMNSYGNGLMGYLEVPAIDLSLGICHGTSTEVLKNGVGHLENTSLPVGGKSTHAVLSAHTGLSDKKLFTDLVLLEEGDMFYIHVLDEVLAYQVDQIAVVEPEDTSLLYVVPDEDLVTLVTCTPYGVNSHRLLVRGTRVPYVEEEKEQTENKASFMTSSWMKQYAIAVAAGTLLVAVILSVGIFMDRKGRKKHDQS